jgi:hypothetical protein
MADNSDKELVLEPTNSQALGKTKAYKFFEAHRKQFHRTVTLIESKVQALHSKYRAELGFRMESLSSQLQKDLDQQFAAVEYDLTEFKVQLADLRLKKTLLNPPDPLDSEVLSNDAESSMPAPPNLEVALSVPTGSCAPRFQIGQRVKVSRKGSGFSNPTGAVIGYKYLAPNPAEEEPGWGYYVLIDADYLYSCSSIEDADEDELILEKPEASV